jgi:hypothetical protein
VLAEGVIETDTADKLKRFLATSAGASPKRDIIISFDSPGGDLAGAVALGRLLRSLNATAYLERNYEEVVPDHIDEQRVLRANALCASACAVAFVGAPNRIVDKDARYGVHQFAHVFQDSDRLSQETVILLAAYFESMGVSRSVIDIASLVPPQSIRFLSRSELREYRVDNSEPAFAKWELKVTPKGLVFASVRQELPQSRGRLGLVLSRIDGMLYLTIAYRPSRDIGDAAGILNGGRYLELVIDDKRQIRQNNPDWSIRDGTIVAAVKLSDVQARMLAAGKILKLETDVPMSSQDLSPDTEFQLESLRTLLPALGISR